VVYKGSYTVSIDAKSRVVFPVAFKRIWEFDAEGNITVQLDPESKSLYFIPESFYGESVSSSKPLLDMNVTVEEKERLMEYHARFAQLTPAENGRLVLTRKMVDCLALEGNEITFVGGGDMVFARCKTRVK
jgi:DNA-binding transcriptional regulator/RsmH inhibitor MraZ